MFTVSFPCIISATLSIDTHINVKTSHISVTGDDGPSGFGFELTFRLKRGPSESSPPTWPAELMQNLARYVFHSGMFTRSFL